MHIWNISYRYKLIQLQTLQALGKIQQWHQLWGSNCRDRTLILPKDAIVVGYYIINDTTVVDYTVAKFSSLVNYVHDTAMNASLNQLVPSVRNKLKSQCTFKAATLHLIKHNMFATEDPSQQPMPFKDMQPYSIYGRREQSLPQQGEQYPYSILWYWSRWFLSLQIHGKAGESCIPSFEEDYPS